MAKSQTDSKQKVQPAQGKLGILMPGMGAVTTTVIAGVEAVRRGKAKPIGSLTQMGRMRTKGNPLFADLVPLAKLDDVVFGGWDVFPETMWEAASTAEVLSEKDLSQVKDYLQSIKPMSAVFDPNYVTRISGANVKQGKTKYDLAQQLIEDIATFKDANKCSRIAMVWAASTERHHVANEVHADLKKFEAGLKNNDAAISPAMIYAYAALKSRVPYANGAPNLALEIGALRELAQEMRVPVAGKDFKTGQTLMKTVLAPMLKARLLGLDGWFSTNILGNRDGEVLADPHAHKTKEESKLSVLDTILEPEQYPELYGDFHHAVRINYYPPRGDDKEAWDNIDIFGWLNYPMQLKVNFLCKDSILAAPVVLDLALFMDLAGRAGAVGVQDWLSFYFKAPMTLPSGRPTHDLFEQLTALETAVQQMSDAGNA